MKSAYNSKTETILCSTTSPMADRGRLYGATVYGDHMHIAAAPDGTPQYVWRYAGNVTEFRAGTYDTLTDPDRVVVAFGRCKNSHPFVCLGRLQYVPDSHVVSDPTANGNPTWLFALVDMTAAFWPMAKRMMA